MESKEKTKKVVLQKQDEQIEPPPVVYTPTPFGPLITYPEKESENQTI